MPRSTVTRILNRPSFRDNITVDRREQTVGSNGRTTTTTTVLSISAVVTSGSVDPARQGDDAAYDKDSIVVHATTKLRGPKETNFPDIVNYNDNKYLVTRVYNWSQYGSGFYAAECSMQGLERS